MIFAVFIVSGDCNVAIIPAGAQIGLSSDHADAAASPVTWGSRWRGRRGI